MTNEVRNGSKVDGKVGRDATSDYGFTSSKLRTLWLTRMLPLANVPPPQATPFSALRLTPMLLLTQIKETCT